ncbi:hypothetical protein N0V93_002582 [Gnomoniopsis smithogilvyi]|uniref:Cytochrome P450 n=1 Tax=Gnomoniopsis smithogilvyi TaxID=1191159 RepID=A0A9W9CZB3_9PEZI|nr:hypothetical protein N0V93_002582 [Gnomoniopsis smithogilvyi]
MIREKSTFHRNLRDKYNYPIYTLRLPFTRMYVVNATELIPTLQKQWRTISFTPILASSGTGPMGMSKEAGVILNRDIQSDSNTVAKWSQAVNRALAPGKALDKVNRRAVEVMYDMMGSLRTPLNNSSTEKKTEVQHETVVDFWSWTHHVMVQATTEAVYGPANPFREAAFEEAWNYWEPRYLTFALSPLKSLLAGKTLAVREFMVAAWAKYFQEGGLKHEGASDFARAMYEQMKVDGLSEDDLARAQVGHSFGIIGTTGPAVWWLIYHIFSDPAVLIDVRNELENFVEVDGGDNQYRIDLAAIRTSCPILLSTFKETMRFRSLGTQIRICLEDHVLGDRYLLKKGGIVVIPQTVQHTSVDAWGQNVSKFDHLRFVKGDSGSGKKMNHTAFRAFGGGHTMCPGRHFSATEIIAFAALMVLQFDVAPVGGGRWEEPTWANSPMSSTFHIPDEDFKISIRPRDSRKWRIDFAKGTGDAGAKGMAVIAEDIENS